jgi:hypothetical protein
MTQCPNLNSKVALSMIFVVFLYFFIPTIPEYLAKPIVLEGKVTYKGAISRTETYKGKKYTSVASRYFRINKQPIEFPFEDGIFYREYHYDSIQISDIVRVKMTPNKKKIISIEGFSRKMVRKFTYYPLLANVFTFIYVFFFLGYLITMFTNEKARCDYNGSLPFTIITTLILIFIFIQIGVFPKN